MPKWYFVRFGVDLNLPSPESLCAASDIGKYDYYKNRMLEQMDTLVACQPNYPDSFKMKKIKYTSLPHNEIEFDDNGMPQIVNKGGIEFVDDEKNYKTQAVYLDELINILTVEIAKNRKNYVDSYQSSICEVMKLLNTSDKTDTLSEGLILLLNSAVDSCFCRVPILNEVVDLTTDAMTSTAKELCNDEYNCTYPQITSLGEAIQPIANILGQLAIFHPNYTATLFKNFDALQTHQPEICLAWVMSFDNNYPSNAVYDSSITYNNLRLLDELNNIGYRTVYINCPVDVEVYCNDKLVGAIIDDTPQESEEYSVITSIEDGGKVVYLPFDADYEIKILATDDGLLDYSISEYSYYTGFTNRVINYYDLELTNGQSYIAELPAVKDAETIIPVDIEYSLSTNNKIITPDSDVNGDEVINQYSTIDVEIDGENYGGVYGGGMYLNGKSVSMLAVTGENGTFVGWFDEDDNMISSEVEYEFVVKNDLSLTAKFEEKTDVSKTTDSSTTTATTTLTTDSTISTNTATTTTTVSDTTATTNGSQTGSQQTTPSKKPNNNATVAVPSNSQTGGNSSNSGGSSDTPKSDSPKTGDDINKLYALLLLSMVVTVAFRKRKSKI